ncbi:MAG: beta-ketoacyl-ACP synthase II [Bacteroidota bacterium]|nr:beta-ketoacyl-ACP synthase II [Bacteroidota bacterium]
MKKRRVVVTGMGTINPLGNTVEAYWKNLLEGVSGVGPITKFDTSQFRTHIAAEVKNFDPVDYIDRKLCQRMDPFTHYAVASAVQAIADAGLQNGAADPERVGVIVGSGIGGMWTNFHQQNLYYQSNSPRHLSPFFVPMLITDIAAGYISILYGYKGPNYATVSACATASHAIGDAFILIERGMADVMVTGGAEAAITPMGLGGFGAMRALSTRNDDPTTASRPFDKDRDGFVMGEGAGILILEELEHARKRGANIYAELAGVGFTADAYHITEPAPGGDGAYRAMRNAVADAGLTPEDIDLVNAHGTSTPYNDKMETEAIKKLFGQRAYAIKVNSTKSMIGHLLGAAGGVEAIATVLMIVHDAVHPTMNLFTPDPECDLDYVAGGAISMPVRAAITNTFGFGGHNTSLVFTKYHEA